LFAFSAFSNTFMAVGNLIINILPMMRQLRSFASILTKEKSMLEKGKALLNQVNIF